MKKAISFLIIISIIVNHSWLCAWGFLGHQTINKKAVFALPPELFGFYKKYIDYVTQHSTDPDNRRYLIAEEGCRHFLDCDFYEKSVPLDTLPHRWNEAVKKYGLDTLNEHGIVPWHCNLMLYKLTEAFKSKDLKSILKTSADIGHYIADAHVPLHSTHNYNGQLTNQEGIHALWESRIPKLYLDSFDILTGTANYLSSPNEFIWDRVEESFSLVDTVLFLEKRATVIVGADNKYITEPYGSVMVKNYSPSFCQTYNGLMENMVEERMRAAIYAVASFWYTAWVNAGQPDLNNLTGDLEKDAADLQLEKLKKEKILGREEQE